ncbi:MAG TPA: hypothetical protein VK718_12470 [Ferruginibacter sp.]|jgi:hypothetical protein|nr:hypothetical protein [Ferruginibacter sp.]
MQTLQPQERAKEIFHTFYKKENQTFFTAKDNILTLIDIYIQESRYGNHLEAVTYWEKVKKEATAL